MSFQDRSDIAAKKLWIIDDNMSRKCREKLKVKGLSSGQDLRHGENSAEKQGHLNSKGPDFLRILTHPYANGT